MSTTGVEPLGVDEWLQTVLTTDPDLLAAGCSQVGQRVYQLEAPQDAAYPLIVYRMVAATDQATVDNRRYAVTGQWDIIAYDDQPNYARLKPIAARVDRLLSGRDIEQTADTIVFYCRRANPIVGSSVLDGGRRERRLGGVYDIIAQDV